MTKNKELVMMPAEMLLDPFFSLLFCIISFAVLFCRSHFKKKNLFIFIMYELLFHLHSFCITSEEPNRHLKLCSLSLPLARSLTRSRAATTFEGVRYQRRQTLLGSLGGGRNAFLPPPRRSVSRP